MHVEIRERRADGSERTVATFRWDGHVVRCDNPVVWNHLIQATGGVVVGERGRKYTPKDGLEFLRNLRFQYRGPHLFTCEVDAAGASGPSAAAEPPAEPAFAVEIPDDPDACRAALDRNLFLVSVCWGALEPTAARLAHGAMLRLLEACAGLTVAEAFADPEQRIKLQNARFGVTPPPVIPRLTARADREWQRLKIAVHRGELRRALIRGQLFGEFLRLISVHGDAWLAELGQPAPQEGCVVGARAGEPEAAWDELEWVCGDGDGALGFLDRASRRASRAIERAAHSAPGGELHQAMVALRQAVTFDPWANEGRTLLGEVLLRMDHPMAEQELLRALLVERARFGAGAPPATRQGSILRQLRQHQALARCTLAQGRIRDGRFHVERALALVDDARELAGSGKGGALDEEAMREVADRLLAVLANLARDLPGGPAPSDGRGIPPEEATDGPGDAQAVGSRAEDPAGVPGPFARGEEPADPH